jgi:hypothetical protein
MNDLLMMKQSALVRKYAKFGITLNFYSWSDIIGCTLRQTAKYAIPVKGVEVDLSTYRKTPKTVAVSKPEPNRENLEFQAFMLLNPKTPKKTQTEMINQRANPKWWMQNLDFEDALQYHFEHHCNSNGVPLNVAY